MKGVIVGGVAASVLRGRHAACPPGRRQERIPGAVDGPLGQLRARRGELPRDREIQVNCRSARRAYHATCILGQYGFVARILSGGVLARAMFFERSAGSVAPGAGSC